MNKSAKTKSGSRRERGEGRALLLLRPRRFIRSHFHTEGKKDEWLNRGDGCGPGSIGGDSEKNKEEERPPRRSRKTKAHSKWQG